jgi:hypothetical protein
MLANVKIKMTYQAYVFDDLGFIGDDFS